MNQDKKAKTFHAIDEEAKPFLKTFGLGKRATIAPSDISVHSGQALGLGGLLGAGRTELAKLIFGIDKPDSGYIEVLGERKSFKGPYEAIREGLAFCPEDRKVEGIIGDLSVMENIILALQAKTGIARMLPRAEQESIARQFVRALNIVTSDLNKPIKDLSGGNQQKVILARWLASNPHLLILDEPTRGIDVGAKAEIIQIIDSLCKQGMALMVISSELDEVVEFSDNVVVLKDRKTVAELHGDAITSKNLIAEIAKERV